MSGDRIAREVVELTRDLIRIDTSNPPGNETPAAELLAGYLREAGVECELCGPDPERLNLIARIPGAGTGPSILLMAHTDVVPAPDANWTLPPFAAEIRDGAVVGRGAIDMKSELAARAVAVAELAREGARPSGDVVLVAEADEERNTADVGMSWLARERPEIGCEFALNEGAGMLLELADGRRVVTISVGEKRVASLRIRLPGRASAAYVPDAADNPLAHLARAIDGLLAHRAPPSVGPALARALATLEAPGEGEEAIEWAAALHPVLSTVIPAMSRMSVTPTGVRTYEPANVIPPYADLICDCRALPGQDVAEIHAHVGAALGDLPHRIELLEPLEGGTESPIDTPLYRACQEYVSERLPGARLLPIVSPGFNDSYWIRRAHGSVAYGFAPVFATDPDEYMRGIHGADEALAVADLVEMARFHLQALRAVAGSVAGRVGAGPGDRAS